MVRDHIPLSNRHQNRLVVGRASNGADTVVSGGQAASNGGFELSVAVSGIVDALEEGECGSVRRIGGSQGVANILADDVGVANDEATAAQLLRCRIVGVVRVGESTQLHVLDLHSNVEVRVGFRLLAREGAGDDGRRHLGLCWYVAHRDAVTGTPLLLDTVGQCLAGAKVDEVCSVSLRFGLAIIGSLRAVLCRAGLDGLGVERGASCSSSLVCLG